MLNSYMLLMLNTYLWVYLIKLLKEIIRLHIYTKHIDGA